MTTFTWEDFASTMVPIYTLRPIILCSKSSTPPQNAPRKIAVERKTFGKRHKYGGKSHFITKSVLDTSTNTTTNQPTTR